MTPDQTSVQALLNVGRRLGDLRALINAGPVLESMEGADALGNEILGRIKAAQQLANTSAVQVAKAAGLPLPDLIEAICSGAPKAS